MKTVTVKSDREVDALVATHLGFYVMAWPARTLTLPNGEVFRYWKNKEEMRLFIARDCPRFTSDPVACSALKKKLREQGWRSNIDHQRVPSGDAFCVALWGHDGGLLGMAVQPTEERAVALAALRAYRIEVIYEN